MSQPANHVRSLVFALIIVALLLVIGVNLSRKQLNDQLVVAVQTGRLAEVQSLLDRHADPLHTIPRPNTNPDQKQSSETLLEIGLGRLQGAEQRFESGPLPTMRPGAMPPPSQSPAIPQPNVDMATLQAKRDEAEAIVLLLIARGASKIPEGQNFHLMDACQSGDPKVLRALLDASPSVAQSVAKTDATAHLISFVLTAHPSFQKDETRDEMISILRQHGAVLSLADAATLGDVETLNRLLGQNQGQDLSKAMRLAIEKKHLEAVQVLLSHGADPNAAEQTTSTLRFAPVPFAPPIIIATGTNNPPMVKLLLEHGADPNRANGHDFALTIACRTRRLEIVRLLLEHKADPNVVTRSGQTPMRIAVLNRDNELVQLLLQHGAKK